MADDVEELDATFADERGRKWAPRLTLPIVDRYCREHGIKFGLFSPTTLSQAQLLDVVYEGIQYQTLFRSAPFTREELLEVLDGPAYTQALVSAQVAIANFTLRCLLPKQQRAAAVRSLRGQIETAKAALDVGTAAGGPGPTSAASALTPESAPTMG